MPISYTENVWRALYRSPGHPGHPDADASGIIWGATATKVLDGYRQAAGTRKDALTGYGLDNNARVGVIGPGVGHLNEYLIDAGITDCWGIEASPYIWANPQLVRPDVLAQYVEAAVGVTPVPDIQTLLKNAGMKNPLRFDWIVDEDAISSQLDDAGINAFLAACEELLQGNAKGRIVHIVTPQPGSDTQILWKSMAEWKQYAPDHTWVDVRTGLVA